MLNCGDGRGVVFGDGGEVELDQGAVLFGDVYFVAIGGFVLQASKNGFLCLVALVDFEVEVVLAVSIIGGVE